MIFERRKGNDRRSMKDRRQGSGERPDGPERRSGHERRSGKDRRNFIMVGKNHFIPLPSDKKMALENIVKILENDVSK